MDKKNKTGWHKVVGMEEGHNEPSSQKKKRVEGRIIRRFQGGRGKKCRDLEGRAKDETGPGLVWGGGPRVVQEKKRKNDTNK